MWEASIGRDNRRRYLGRFKNLDDAIKARLKAEKEKV